MRLLIDCILVESWKSSQRYCLIGNAVFFFFKNINSHFV